MFPGAAGICIPCRYPGSFIGLQKESIMSQFFSGALPFLAIGALVLCVWLFMLAGSRVVA